MSFFVHFLLFVAIAGPLARGQDLSQYGQLGPITNWLQSLNYAKIPDAAAIGQWTRDLAQRAAIDAFIQRARSVSLQALSQFGIDKAIMTCTTDDVEGSSFNCTGRRQGYYADVATECKVFHLCYQTLKLGLSLTPEKYFERITFYCDAATTFDQSGLVCKAHPLIRCQDSLYHFETSNLYLEGATNEKDALTNDTAIDLPALKVSAPKMNATRLHN